MTIYAIIPAFNEAKSVATIIQAVLKNVSKCIVVDDGSTDNTESVAHKAGARVIHLPLNTGTGSATKAGIRYAAANGANVVCLLDADGQHNASYIPSLLMELRNGADLVIGSRYSKPTRSSTSLFRCWWIRGRRSRGCITLTAAWCRSARCT